MAMIKFKSLGMQLWVITLYRNAKSGYYNNQDFLARPSRFVIDRKQMEMVVKSYFLT